MRERERGEEIQIGAMETGEVVGGVVVMEFPGVLRKYHVEILGVN